eukprot:COSAG01_NODE_3913_length_5545_cov_4.588505_8_plen_51_part_00
MERFVSKQNCILAASGEDTHLLFIYRLKFGHNASAQSPAVTSSLDRARMS